MEETEFKQRLSLIQKLSKDFIPQAFDYFKRDLHSLKYKPLNNSDKKMMSKLRPEYDTIKANLNGTIIFDIEMPKEDINFKYKVLPFNKMFISTDIVFPLDGEIYSCGGYFIIDFGEDILVFFIWTRNIEDGWFLENFLIRKVALNKSNEELSSEVLVEGSVGKEKKKFLPIFMDKFHLVMKSLLNKIDKQEYFTYKKWKRSGYETHNIIYSKLVASHIRHLWADTGYFNIPKLTIAEIKDKGYSIHEVVYKDGELRRDVPYVLIGAHDTKGLKNKDIENRRISLIKKKLLRQEEKIHSILRQLYPDKVIKRHERRTLHGLELDFYLPEIGLAIEYDGEQHFDEELYIKLYGDGFKAQVHRDKIKNRSCIEAKIKLVRIKYDEPLTLAHIRKRLRD
jgi:hypothetical protein